MSDIPRLSASIRAEVDGDADKIETVESIIPALQTLADSLDIPVTITAEFVPGPGRLSIGYARPYLHRGNPKEGTLQNHEVWCYAEQLINSEVASRIWNHWYPDRADQARDNAFLALLEESFKDAVGLGYRLTRFRDAFGRLSAQADAAEWRDALETVIGAADCPQLRLFVSPAAYREAVEGPTPDVAAKWKDQTKLLADGLLVELGILYPSIQVDVDPGLDAEWYRCEWNDLRLPARKGIRSSELLVSDTAAQLASRGFIGAVEAENPATRVPAAILPIAEKEALEAIKLTTWDLPGYLILALAAAIRESAGALVNAPFTEYCLLTIERSFPELVAAVEARYSRASLTRILRSLLAGAVPVNDLTTILNALVTLQSVIRVNSPPRPILDPLLGVCVSAVATRVEDLTVEAHVEYCRRRLSRTIGTKFSRGTGTLVVYLLDSETERRFESGRLDQGERIQLIEGIRAVVRHLPPAQGTPLLLVSGDFRPLVQQALFPEYRHMSVLSFSDLHPDLNIQPLARISPARGT